MLADSQLNGVYVAVTNPSNTSFSQNAGGVITVQAGSITVSQDPSFNATQVTGGSTNVVIAQYTLADYSEGVKISQLAVTPSVTGGAVTPSQGDTTSLNNVGLYVDNGSGPQQVGSLQNWTAADATNNTPLVFNLGGSLVINSGQTVKLIVKADTINSSYSNYTNGNLAVTLSGEPNNAQGLTSNVLSEVPSTGIVSNTLTLGVGAITLVTNPAVSAHSILANTANQEIGSYILNDNSSEAAQLTNVTVGLTGSTGNTGNIPLTSLSNLRTSITTTPVNPSVTNSFSVNSVIPANGSQEIDVFADVGQIATLANTYCGNFVRSCNNFVLCRICSNICYRNYHSYGRCYNNYSNS